MFSLFLGIHKLKGIIFRAYTNVPGVDKDAETVTWQNGCTTPVPPPDMPVVCLSSETFRDAINTLLLIQDADAVRFLAANAKPAQDIPGLIKMLDRKAFPTKAAFVSAVREEMKDGAFICIANGMDVDPVELTEDSLRDTLCVENAVPFQVHGKPIHFRL